MNHYFEGYYFKHQQKGPGGRTLCIIVGYADKERFIQIITEDFSAKVPFTNENYFSENGIRLNIKTPQLTLTGRIGYWNLTPIKYDIMGPFRHLPMECRHGIVSMYHRLDGKVRLNGEVIDFTNGIGYLENDSGRSFPSSYIWIQANDFSKPGCSVMASVARIPFCGMHFRGCICVVKYEGREYRLATYLGVRVVLCTKNRIILKQGKYLLEIRVKNQNGRRLRAPVNGEMSRMIWETTACPAEFTFYINGKCRFSLRTERASFECEMKGNVL